MPSPSLDPIACGLPHREPFIFVDKIVALAPGERATATKTFHEDEPFFRGHFPGDPLVPGVILTEALAQTAGLAAGQPGRSFRLSAIKLMKFHRAVRPGDELVLSADNSGEMGGLWQFRVEAQVRGEVVAEGVVVLNDAPVKPA